MNLVYVTPDVQSIMGIVDTHVRWKSRTSSRQRSNLKDHPSSFGRCLRQAQYMRYVDMGLIDVKEEEFDSQLLRLFGKGHNMHHRWQMYFEEAGVLRGIWECNNPYCSLFNDQGRICAQNGDLAEDVLGGISSPRKYGTEDKLGCFRPAKCICGCRDFKYHEVVVNSDDLNLYGHVDDILDFSCFDGKQYKDISIAFDIDKLPKNPVVVDMKTINDYQWKKLLNTGPSLTYRVQLCIYANLLDVEYGLLIYENKNNSDIKTFKIEKNENTMFVEIQKQAKLMNAMAALSTPKVPPPRPMSKDDYSCRNCGMRSMCHKSKIWDDDKALRQQRIKFYGNLL